MTTITFESEGARLVGFTAEGHSGLSEAGSDILCAAITSAIRLTECALSDILGLNLALRQVPERALLSLKLPSGLSEEIDEICQTLLAATLLHFVQLAEEYSDHLIVLEV